MAGRITQEQKRQKKLNTRDLSAFVEEYIERHSYDDPVIVLLKLSNGVSFDAECVVKDEVRCRAASELMKYLYVPRSQVEISGQAEIALADIKINQAVADSLARKLHDAGLGNRPTVEEIDFDDL